jgi:hypothetical protein
MQEPTQKHKKNKHTHTHTHTHTQHNTSHNTRTGTPLNTTNHIVSSDLLLFLFTCLRLPEATRASMSRLQSEQTRAVTPPTAGTFQREAGEGRSTALAVPRIVFVCLFAVTLQESRESIGRANCIRTTDRKLHSYSRSQTAFDKMKVRPWFQMKAVYIMRRVSFCWKGGAVAR